MPRKGTAYSRHVPYHDKRQNSPVQLQAGREEKSWNVELGRVSGRSIAAQETNRMLDKIRVGINQAYQKIADRDNYVTAEKVRNAYLGLGMNHETLLAVFRQHNEDYGKQVGKLKSPRSYWKYCTMYKHLSEFVEKRYKVSDIAFKELTPAFITDFELFLKVEKNHCNNTVWSYMMRFGRLSIWPSITACCNAIRFSRIASPKRRPNGAF